MPYSQINAYEYETMDDLLRAIVGPKNLSSKSSKEWAGILGLALSSLYAKGKTDEEGRNNSFTLRQLRAVVACGEISPVTWLAAQYPAPGITIYQRRVFATGKTGLMEALAATIKEFGEFAAETAAGISDGRITLDEYHRIKKEGDEAIAAIETMFMQAEEALNN